MGTTPEDLLADPANDDRVLLFDSIKGAEILFIRLKDVRRWISVTNASTWGELSSSGGAEVYQWLIEEMAGPPCYATFDEFFERDFDGSEDRRAEALTAWAAEPIGEIRPPFPDEPIDIDGWNHNHDYPIRFFDRMDDWVPPDIQDRFGTVDDYSQMLVLRDPVLLGMIEASLPDRLRETILTPVGEQPVEQDVTSPSPAPYVEKSEAGEYLPVHSPLLDAFASHGYRCLRSALVRDLAGYGLWG